MDLRGGRGRLPAQRRLEPTRGELLCFHVVESVRKHSNDWKQLGYLSGNIPTVGQAFAGSFSAVITHPNSFSWMYPSMVAKLAPFRHEQDNS